jgi:DNA-binding NtrC family response regulator
MSSEPAFEIIQFMRNNPVPRLRSFASRELLLLPDASGATSGSVCMMTCDNLNALLNSVPHGLIIDRGHKNPSKRLADYLAGRDGLLAIRTDYKAAGQASRGVRSLLDVTEGSKASAVFFIGVPEPVFNLLRVRAESAASQAGTTKNPDELLGDGCGINVPDVLREKFIGNSEAAEWVRRAIVLAASMDRQHAILIQGESGTGKEIVARQIHNLSGCSLETFFAVNCGGIPTELLESELFGHVRGSFTGAIRNKQGLWTLADRGTLFLDEIGDLSPRHQVKVLRALSDRKFTPVGAEKEVQSDARVIAATNRDLGQMVKNGTFREDLFYRLFTFRIRTPALREHPEDIPVLARYLWTNDHRDGPLTKAVTDTLRQFRWPGNVRELRAFLINLAVVANGRRIDVPLVHAVMRDRTGPVLAERRDQ